MSLRPSSAYLDRFNEASREGRLVVPCCAGCGATMDYAQRLCRCGIEGVRWMPASGHAIVTAATVYHRAYSNANADAFTPPYAVIQLLLNEGVRLTAHVPRIDTLPPIGTAVRVALDPQGRLTVLAPLAQP